MAHAPAARDHAGVRHYFCSDHCAEQFEPDRRAAITRTGKAQGAMQQERIIEQLEKMVASGRITPEEAARLRASAGTPDFDAVMGEIRARHAQVHTDAAVATGRLSQEKADASLDRVRGGEHPAAARAQIRGRADPADGPVTRSRPLL